MPVFMDLVRSRRSIRRFLPGPVESDKLEACLEAARLAPSAHNAQPWRFLVVDDPGLKDELGRAAFSGIYGMSRFAAQAPVIVVILARKDLVAHHLGRQIQKTAFHLIDIGIAGEHFILQAEELGLSTCWMGWFSPRKARRVLKVPRKYKIVAFVPVGYAASRPPRETVRLPLAEIAWRNRVGASVASVEDKACANGPAKEE
jgi:nitroreductase